MNKNDKTEFIPFHAINEFMRNDFRLQVIRSVLGSLPEFDKEIISQIDRLTRKHVKVAGFRNSTKAPTTVKAVAMVKAFEKQPELVATILNAWALTKSELRQYVFDLLLSRGWTLLPMEADRTKLPGFLTRWPIGEDYDTLYNSLLEREPGCDASIDEASLMAVLLSCRLPIEKVEMDELHEFDSVDSTSPINE